MYYATKLMVWLCILHSLHNADMHMVMCKTMIHESFNAFRVNLHGLHASLHIYVST